jgi:hypothetical protein
MSLYLDSSRETVVSKLFNGCSSLYGQLLNGKLYGKIIIIFKTYSLGFILYYLKEAKYFYLDTLVLTNSNRYLLRYSWRYNCVCYRLTNLLLFPRLNSAIILI